MTSIASSKGDVGAEMLASQIGAYFDLAIRIIEFHGGDVVKVQRFVFLPLIAS
jgi:class 3 adenylate cyclase